MNFRSISISFGLGLVVSLLPVGNAYFAGLKTPKSLAQGETSSCPLPAQIAVTFLNSQCEAVTLDDPQTFYRYYSSSQNKYGRYLTTDQYQTNVEVIRNLALNQSWGNRATMILKVTLPEGTTVYQGIVAPQNPAECYPGGGQQTFIEDSKSPNIHWSEGGSLRVENFSCPQN